MFKVLSCKKFKFADDGKLLVTGHTETQIYLNCQVCLKQLERWCKIRGLQSMVTDVYLNSENTHARKCFGETCTVTRNTKILGLIADNKLDFNYQLQQVERKIAKQLNTFEQFCCSNWGLKQATLKEHYRSPVLLDF